MEQEGAGSCQREAARLAERNAWLRLALGSREDELIRTQKFLQAFQAEKEMLQREVSRAGLPPRDPWWEGGRPSRRHIESFVHL